MGKSRLHRGMRSQRIYKLICRQRACVYCGQQSTGMDHFTPISVMRLLITCMDYLPTNVAVPCCAECNTLASNYIFRTIAAKRRFIHERLKRRYRKILNIPPWTEEELGELGYVMQDFIKKGQEEREWLLQRLAWRNTSNKGSARLAGVRFPSIGGGRSSAVRSAGNPGTTRNATKS